MAARGAYNTRQKDVILRYLASRPGEHMTADALVEGLRAAGEVVGRTTAYRQLERLVAQGVARRYAAPSGAPVCYAYVDAARGCDTHLHCRCTGCGELFHVECEELDHLAEHFRSAHRFEMDACQTVIYGLCGRCAGKGSVNGAVVAEERDDEL